MVSTYISAHTAIFPFAQKILILMDRFLYSFHLPPADVLPNELSSRKRCVASMYLLIISNQTKPIDVKLELFIFSILSA